MLRKPTLYSIVIWLTAVLCSPILFSLITTIYNDEDTGMGFFIIPYAWIFGGFLSIPSFIILLILNFQLAKRNLSNTTYVGILLIICTGLAVLAFGIFSIYFGGEFSIFNLDLEFIALLGSYLISLYSAILSGLFSPAKKNMQTLDASELTADIDL